MRLSPRLTILMSVVLVAAALGLAFALLRPAGPPLASAEFSLTALTPNADGDADVTRIRYRLRRPASVSIYFLHADGRRFDFRLDRPREAGEGVIDFSGIVDPFRLPDDDFDGELLARVLPDGAYRWVIEARDAAGQANAITGPLSVAGADTRLPALRNLTVSPAVFTPNQDGLNDRATINVWLDKDIGAGGLRLWLIDQTGARQPIAERPRGILPGQRGLHEFDYDGGIDLGQNPPADGDYLVRAEAEDRLGQRVAVTARLSIRDGGLPRADIYLGQVEWSASTLIVGNTLRFTLTVENYGAAPIRTSGPPSGFVYGSMADTAAGAGWFEESGAWRVGINCDTCQRDYPWRWALGTPETLTAREEDGRIHYYLLPGQRAVVTGGIVLDTLIERRNPQYFWAGLIHEDVEIAAINNRVDPELITLEAP